METIPKQVLGHIRAGGSSWVTEYSCLYFPGATASFIEIHKTCIIFVKEEKKVEKNLIKMARRYELVYMGIDKVIKKTKANPTCHFLNTQRKDQKQKQKENRLFTVLGWVLYKVK